MDYSRLFFGDGDDHHHHHHLHHHLHHQQQPPQPSPKKEVQLQGPRPTPLRVSKDSHTIRKPPRHPPPNNPPAKHPPPPDDPPQPVIIYAVSPKVIHVEESDFMSLVQRLTGQSPSGPRAAGDVSPAARFASIERASPKHRQIMGLDGTVGRDQGTTSSSTMTNDGFDLAAAARGSMPGILSPAPSSLPAIPSGFFSPLYDSPAVPLFQDLAMSPLLHGSGGGTGPGFFGGGGSGSILSSPSSAWFSSSLISPSPTSLDLYSLLDF
ncbi:hypothetical protein MLD38_036309 [Melastoma candidum]|uniref:Uncharacterized protein n=1 Tax=Melastoma candidum TaxID=119954 RepID=A0ACB9LJQ4_9MYRT|nr:hypothetical protein MLD38_036309 [Melastoma candidum]